MCIMGSDGKACCARSFDRLCLRPRAVEPERKQQQEHQQQVMVVVVVVENGVQPGPILALLS